MFTFKPTNSNMIVVIDDLFAKEVAASRWHIHDNGHGNLYVRTMVGKNQFVTLQDFIWYLAGNDTVVKPNLIDHVNGDGLDCRLDNLREVTKKQNSANRGPDRDNKVGLKGVSPTGYGQFVAQICIDGQRLRLGKFDRPEDAARIYDRAAVELFGEYAYVNGV